jgi:hypothetical protein
MNDPSGGNLFVDVGQGPLKAPSSAGVAACYRLYQRGKFSSGSGPMTDAQVITDLRNAYHGDRDRVLVVVLVSSEEVQVSDLVRAAKTIAKGCRSGRPLGGKNLDVRIYFEFPYDEPGGNWKNPSLGVEVVGPPH